MRVAVVVFVVVAAAVHRKKYRKVHMATPTLTTVVVGKAARLQATVVYHRIVRLTVANSELALVLGDVLWGRGSGLPDEDNDDKGDGEDEDEDGGKDRSKVLLLLLGRGGESVPHHNDDDHGHRMMNSTCCAADDEYAYDD